MLISPESGSRRLLIHASIASGAEVSSIDDLESVYCNQNIPAPLPYSTADFVRPGHHTAACPTDPLAWLSLGVELANLYRLNEARGVLSTIHTLHPDLKEVYWPLGVLLFYSGHILSPCDSGAKPTRKMPQKCLQHCCPGARIRHQICNPQHPS